jgi:hypothetical protein
MEFKLYDAPAGGTQIGFTQTANNIGIIDGIVTIELTFGTDAFNGQGRWLEISIRPGASTGAYTILNPRQSITSSPYSWFSVRPVPSGAVMYFNLQTCPVGWSELAAGRGRYIVGLQPGGTLASTVGGALTAGEDRAVGQHAHGIIDPGHAHGIFDPGHSHSYVPPVNLGTGSGNSSAKVGGSASTGSSQTGITIDPALTGITVQPSGTVAGTNAPYIVLIICQKD